MTKAGRGSAADEGRTGSATVDSVHFPVLRDEVVEYLKPRGRRELMIDATVGEGGHAETLLRRYSSLRLVGLDADPVILGVARQRLSAFGERAHFYNNWFNQFFKDYPSELDRPDTILFDLGISSFHFELSGRGFSFRKDEPLDMRLGEDLETSAADIVNDYPEGALAGIIFEYGEERLSRTIARAIVNAREKGRIETTRELAEVIARAVPAKYRSGRIHPATRSFQAIRIAVNGELMRLEAGLASALTVLKVDGRIAVISFHSLEDRIVKRFFREKNKSCTCPPEQPICNCEGRRILEIVTKKPVVPGEKERLANPPSRSAKLRVAVKLAEE